MPLSPAIEFHHTPEWVQYEQRVIMTPMRVWYPMNVPLPLIHALGYLIPIGLAVGVHYG